MEPNRSQRRRTCRRSREEVVGDDIISSLPDHIAHHIISFLPDGDVSRLFILSRRWESLWATFPIFNFDEWHFLGKGIPMCRDFLLDSLQKSLSRRDMTHMQKLRICTLLLRDSPLDLLVARYIDLAMKGKVQVLDLNFASEAHPPNSQCESCYVLPGIIFSLGSFMVSLMLEGCRFLDYDVVNFPSLKEVFMKNTHITDQTLEKMIGGCPLIESLSIKRCHGLKTLRVFSRKLRLLTVGACRELEAFEMDVPSLRSFKYEGNKLNNNNNNNNNDDENFEISGFQVSNADSFSSLDTIYLSNSSMKAKIFYRMTSSSPNLEFMSIKNCKIARTPRPLCGKLKTFVVENCDFQGPLDVVAPNLQSFTYIDTFKICKIRSAGGTGCKSLRALSLVGYVDKTDGCLLSMVSNCPLLKILNLISCIGFKHFKISSQTLKYLSLDKCHNVEGCDIETPNLIYFKYVGAIVEFHSFVASEVLNVELELPQLDGPHIHIDFQHIKFRKFLRQFEHVQIMKLVSKCSECMIIPREVSSWPPLIHLKDLKVETTLGNLGYVDLLRIVMRLALCLGSLNINLGSAVMTLKFRIIPRPGEIFFINPHDCVRHHLAEVEMINFEGYDEEMQLVEYLLGKALSLETLLISIKKKACPRAHLQRLGIMRRIKKYLRVSPSCELVFC